MRLLAEALRYISFIRTIRTRAFCIPKSSARTWDRITERVIAFVYHVRLICYVFSRWGYVIHIIGLLRFPVITGIIEGLLFRAIGQRYILTVHNVLPHDRHTKTKRKLYKFIYNIPHHLVVHTETMKAELVELFAVPDARIVVMQHGLNDIVPDHRKERGECQSLLGIPEDKCVLLFFGKLRPYKGVETLLDGFTRLDQRFFLVIAGMADKVEYGQKITHLVANHPHRDRILLTAGWIKNEDVATYLRAADVLVMPYKHIDQSGVIFLAFRFGLPIVAFDVGVLKEYVKADHGVLVEGDSAENLVDGILCFYHQRKRFIQSQINTYAQEFEWPKVSAPVVKLYASPSG